MKNYSSLVPGRLLAVLLLMLLAVPGARAQAWRTALAFEPTSSSSSFTNNSVRATATDASGNVYLTGTYSGTTRFGSFTLTGSTSPSRYVANAFVAKWSPASNSFLWAYSVGGNDEAVVTAIAVSGSSVYLTGFFYSPTATFGNRTLTNSSATGGGDIFVAKLTDAGNSASFTWVQQANGTNTDVAYALAVSGSSVYLAGYFYSNSLTFGSTTLIRPGNAANMFVAKLTDQGNSAGYDWAEQVTATEHYIAPTALAVNGPNVYLTGYFASPQVSFGPFTLTKNSGGRVWGYLTDAFVAKLTDTGSSHGWTWVQQSSGAGYDQTLALAVNGPNVYVAGYFGSTARSLSGAQGNTPLTFGATTLNNFGDYDGYVAKLTDAGSSSSFTWAHRVGGLDTDSVTALTVRGSQVYFAGTFASQQASFGNNVLTKATGPNSTRDVFVGRLTDAGSTSSFDWVQQAGGPGGDFVNTIALNGNTLYVAGGIGGPASFGSQSVAMGSTPNLHQLGFLASITDLTATRTSSDLIGTAFHLFPNPARSITTVQLPAIPGATQATLVLTDALGRRVCARTVALPTAGLRYDLPLTGLPPGVYALHVEAGAASAVRRLVVE